MPLRFDEFVALVKAGYTKEDIDKMEAAEDAFKAGQQKAEQPKPEEKPAEQPKPEEVKKPDQSAAGNPADSAAMAGLAEEIEALRKAVQAMNVKNAYRTDDQNVTAESILASIIQPAKKDK